MWDEVRVYFKDGTSTIIYVHEDDNIQDAIIEECEDQGWDFWEVADYAILGTVESEND